MAGAAGFALRHIRHGEVALLFQIIDTVVANLAIAGHVLVAHVDGMTENHLARILCLEGNILKFNSRAGKCG